MKGGSQATEIPHERSLESKYLNLSLLPFFDLLTTFSHQRNPPLPEARRQESPFAYPDKPGAWRQSRIKARVRRAAESYAALNLNHDSKYMQCKQFNKLNYEHQKQGTSILILNYSHIKGRVRKQCCIRQIDMNRDNILQFYNPLRDNKIEWWKLAGIDAYL